MYALVLSLLFTSRSPSFPACVLQVVVMVDGRDPSACLPVCSLLQAAEMFVPGVPDVTVHQSSAAAAAAAGPGGGGLGGAGAGATPAGTSLAVSTGTATAGQQPQQLHVGVDVPEAAASPSGRPPSLMSFHLCPLVLPCPPAACRWQSRSADVAMPLLCNSRCTAAMCTAHVPPYVPPAEPSRRCRHGAVQRELGQPQPPSRRRAEGQTRHAGSHVGGIQPAGRPR